MPPDAGPAPLIFVVGAPRSGTTWLAKIIDSHPDVLYRHEPDDADSLPEAASPVEVAAVVRRWCADRTPRSAAKRPLFRKTYRRRWQSLLRHALAAGSSAASRLPAPLRWLASAEIPDLTTGAAACTVIKSIRAGAATLAQACPQARLLFVLRHPGGQVASVILGARLRRFDLKTAGADMPFDEAATLRFVAGFGLSDAEFQALPDAAKYAWAWRAFNEPACAALATLPNARVIVYETLCAHPEPEARALLAFCGLDWTPQTQDFVRRSATSGDTGYYGVFRDAKAAAAAWRSSLSAAEQEAIRSVVGNSPLAPHWPDLVKCYAGDKSA